MRKFNHSSVKMQSDFVNPNIFSSPFAYGNKSNNTYNKQASQNQPNSNSLFGDLNIQSLLPLLMSGNSKNGLMQMLTNSNPEMATMLNILNKTNKKQPKTNVEDSCQGFDMSSYTKCSDYFKR